MLVQQGVGSGPVIAAGTCAGSGSARAAKRRCSNKTPAKHQWRTPQVGQQQRDHSVQDQLQPVTDVRQQSDLASQQEQKRQPLAPQTKSEQQQGQLGDYNGEPADKGSRDLNRQPVGGHENNRQGKQQPGIKWWEDRGGIDDHGRDGSPHGQRSTRGFRDGHDRRAGTDRYSRADRHDRQGETERPHGNGRSRMDVMHDRSNDYSSRDRRQDSRCNSSGWAHKQPDRKDNIKRERVNIEISPSRGYAGRELGRERQHKHQQRQEADKQQQQQQSSWRHHSRPSGASWADEVDRAEADAADDGSLSEGEVDPRCGSRDSTPREGRRSSRPTSAQLTPAKRASSQVGIASH